MAAPHWTLNRRQVLAAAAAGATVAIMPAGARAAGDANAGFHICAFEKFLQDLSFEQLADTLADLGFNGVEATVRRGGHVAPENVRRDLPRMRDAMAARGLEITLITTDVTRADDPLHQQVLRTASELGVQRYRMGYYTYDLSLPIVEQLDEIRPHFEKLAEFNHELGVTGLYQNHSGNGYVGATLWDLHRLLRGIPPEDLGSAFDIRHATVEAGLSWEVLYRLMKPHIGVVYVKDFRWKGRDAEQAPLGSGIDPRFFRLLKEDAYKGPISLHVEYLPDAGLEQNIEAIRVDMKTLRGWLNA